LALSTIFSIDKANYSILYLALKGIKSIDKAKYNFLYLALSGIFTPDKAKNSHEVIYRKRGRSSTINRDNGGR
jgi:hypothetical protein